MDTSILIMKHHNVSSSKQMQWLLFVHQLVWSDQILRPLDVNKLLISRQVDYCMCICILNCSFCGVY